uniref:Uncharacterized protein n=1 Tax=Triticum urartu TaxID=4572 RepID=A0A8R7P0D2_TRIUA
MRRLQGGNLLPGAAWRARVGAAPRASLVAARTPTEEATRWWCGRPRWWRTCRGGGAGGRGGWAPPVAGRARLGPPRRRLRSQRRLRQDLPRRAPHSATLI